MRTTPNDFSDRYAANWQLITRLAHCMTRRTCTYCMVRPSEEVHHAYYRTDKGKPLAGGEVPGRDVFPLCQQCHEIAHNPVNWIKDRQNPKLGNHNTPAFTQQLRLNFRILTHGTRSHHQNLRRKKAKPAAKRS